MPLTAEALADLDATIGTWRQGDVILDDAPPFVFLADLARPLTTSSEEQAAETDDGSLDVVATEEVGLAVVSQTCDLVRSCADRPFAEVSPVVELSQEAYAQVEKGRRPQFFALGSLKDKRLAVDLDRTMTIEKAVLVPSTGKKHSGVTSEPEARAFADAAARKRNRAAFPDDFASAMEPVRRRILEKHGKASSEGRFLAGIQEMRVAAIPSWAGQEVQIAVLFIYDRVQEIPEGIDELINALLARFNKSDRYPEIEGRAVALESLPARDYLGSDRLDLEHLSQAP